MTKDQKELQEIVSQLRRQGYQFNEGEFYNLLTDDEAFIRLEKLATKERHPEGSDHLLTGRSWQELDLMLHYAESPKGFVDAENAIRAEIQRRLLALIPNS